MAVVCIMGRLQVNSGGAGTGPLLSVFLNGNAFTYYLVAGGREGCRRSANELVRDFPQP